VESQRQSAPITNATRVWLVAFLHGALLTAHAASVGAQATAARPLVYGATLPLVPLDALTNEWTEASAALLSRLYTIDPSGRLVGDLVEAHEVSADGRTWTLRLRRGVRWHDGTPFTSADVLFTFAALRRTAPGTARWRDLDVIDRFEAPGPHAFVVHLKAPRPGLAVPLVDVPILPRHVLEGHDVAEGRVFDARPIGTGPYRLAERPGDGRLVLEAHESYHLGRPSIQRLVMVPLENDEARARAVAESTVDLAHVKPQHMTLVQGRDDVRLYRYRSGIWRSLVLNVRQPHLQDRRVRQAIALALDRDAMVAEGLLGVGEPAFSAIPPISWAYAPPVRPPGRDLPRARALLDEAGWRVGSEGWRARDGRVFELALAVWWDEPFRRAASEVVKRNLESIGLRVRFVRIPGERYEAVAASLGAEHDGIISGYSGLLDPGDNLASKYRAGGSQNAGGYSNPELDALLDRALQEADRERARALYRQALPIIEADAARIPLVYVDYLFGARRELRGMGDDVLDLYYHFPRLAYTLAWPDGR